MYKIYINDRLLTLMETRDAIKYLPADENRFVLRYNGKSKHIIQIADMLEKSNRDIEVILYSNDLKALFKTFKSLYKFIKAAGGVVFNQQGEILTMYRRGSWDLPKGKIDKGEGKKDAALREVREETGIQNIELKELVARTFHTYKHGGRRVLKKTYWYKMITSDMELTPQEEEDIEIVAWEKPDSFLKSKKMYPSIVTVLNEL